MVHRPFTRRQRNLQARRDIHDVAVDVAFLGLALAAAQHCRLVRRRFGGPVLGLSVGLVVHRRLDTGEESLGQRVDMPVSPVQHLGVERRGLASLDVAAKCRGALAKVSQRQPAVSEHATLARSCHHLFKMHHVVG